MTSRLLTLLALIFLTLGCGYRVASSNRQPLDIRTVLVEPLRNETTTFEVEQVLTRSLVHAFVERTGYRVVNDTQSADAVLTGVIGALSANPVTFGQQSFGSTFQVTLNARVVLQEKESGKILFRNDSYIFREQYQINVDVRNFFTELNPALDRIAEDFANSVVTSILENF